MKIMRKIKSLSHGIKIKEFVLSKAIERIIKKCEKAIEEIDGLKNIDGRIQCIHCSRTVYKDKLCRDHYIGSKIYGFNRKR